MNETNHILKFDLKQLIREENRIRKHNEMIHFYNLTRPENYIRRDNTNNTNNTNIKNIKNNECYFNDGNDFLNNTNNNTDNNTDTDNTHNDIHKNPPNIVNNVNVNHYHVYVEKCKKDQDEKREALEKLNQYLEIMKNKYKHPNSQDSEDSDDNQDIEDNEDIEDSDDSEDNQDSEDSDDSEDSEDSEDNFNKLQRDTNKYINQQNNIVANNHNNNLNILDRNKEVLPYLDDIDDNFLKSDEDDSDSDSDDSTMEKITTGINKENDKYEQIKQDQKYVKVLLSDLKDIEQGIIRSNKQFQAISDIAESVKL